MTKVESAVRWMENLASDNRHGYSQANRWGPDYDCSSAVISAYQQAGIPVKDYGATYTGNMEPAFLKAGFKVVTNTVNLRSGVGLKRGDVLLNIECHTAMYVGNNRVVHARSSEGNPQTGDQSGNEIRVQSYWNFPWDCVLRYPEEKDVDIDEDGNEKPKEEKKEGGLEVDGIAGFATWNELVKNMPSLSILTADNRPWATSALQAMLNYYGADLDVDGDFGPLTAEALQDFQRAH